MQRWKMKEKQLVNLQLFILSLFVLDRATKLKFSTVVDIEWSRARENIVFIRAAEKNEFSLVSHK